MKVLVLPLVLMPVIFADIRKIAYPPELEECLKNWDTADATQITGESAASSCMFNFAWYNEAKLHPYIPDETTMAYINNMSKNPLSKRQKRGTFPTRGRPRQRKEYRLLTRRQRARYHNCMNLLKTTDVPGGDMSQYDAIAAIHNAGIAGSAHGGANFLSWHRVYLYTLENALRAVNESCRRLTLPYWDCTAEYYANQIQSGSGDRSIIFTRKFAGNGDGEVTTGAFRDWGLVRNVGNSASLFGREAIELIKTKESNKEITMPYAKGFPRVRYNLEYYHNRIHVYIGGFLLNINLAPRDPFFFLLHAYVDFIWEEFRQSLISRGLDAEEYPPWESDRHHPDRPMEGFPEWTNGEGYSNQWYERIAQYKPSFNCDVETNCQLGLRRKPWISCKSFPDGNRCTANPMFEEEDSRRRRNVAAQSGSTYKKAQICTRESCLFPDSCIQNTFSANNVINADQWVYIPAMIIYERSEGLRFNTYEAYSTKKGKSLFNYQKDTYDPSISERLEDMLYTGKARTYDNCRISSSGSSKVFIRAEGISYSGNSVEYAIVDGRLPVMSQKAFIPIKAPDNNESTEVCLMAYDECGRICLPTCLVKGSSPTVYKPCTGCIRVDIKTPKRYGHTIAEVIENNWAFQDVHDEEYICPAEQYRDLYLKFVCDASVKLPWQRLKTE